MSILGKLNCLLLSFALIFAIDLEARNMVFKYTSPDPFPHIEKITIAAIPIFFGGSGQAIVQGPNKTVTIRIPDGGIGPYFIHANRLDGEEFEGFGRLTISIDGGEEHEVILLKDIREPSIVYSFIL